MEQRQDLARKVAQLIEILPPMPDNIARLMAIRLDSTDGYMEALGLIENDPGLCTDLLHLANNFRFDSAKPIETINDAVNRIGIQPLVQLIAVAYAGKTIKKEFAILQHLNDYFRHSQDISLCCQILAGLQDLPGHQRQMFAVAGLIHDIGRLIIMVASNKTTVHLMGTSWEKMTTVVGDEKKILGLNHCDVGMQLCSKWNFSPVLQEGVLRHHTPLINTDFSFPGGVIFISHFVSFSDLTGEILSTMVGPELLNCLHLTLSDFCRAQQIFQSRVADLGQKPTGLWDQI